MKNAPRKALLLAAGFGSRMQPLSFECPKPLMPLWNKPMLEHAIDLLISWGVRDILINIHHNPEKILNHCRNLTRENCRIQLSFEPDILGTGGALQRAQWFLQSQPFWVLNTDIAAELNPRPLINAVHNNNALAALWMHPADGPRTVELHHNRITNFASKNPGSKNTATFCGLQIVSPKIFQYLPQKKFFSIIDAYRNAMQNNETIAGICIKDAFWADLGTRERYIAAHAAILNAYKNNLPGKSLLPAKTYSANQSRIPDDCNINGFAAIAPSTSFGKNIQLENSVIWQNTCLTDNTTISSSVIGTNLTLRDTIHNSLVTGCSNISSNTLTPSLQRLHTSPENANLISLPARGSNRSFTRIQTPKKSAILIQYDDTARPENARYAAHSQLLKKHGIRVPGILLDMPDKKATLFEDAGTLDLTCAARQLPTDQTIAIYKKVISQLVKMHAIDTSKISSLEPPFSPELYHWEHNLFTTNFLTNHLKLSPHKIRKIKTELNSLIAPLQNQPQVLLHRDMQSSNILLTNNRPTIIDFQGMRLGPAMYDIASLLCDPYVMLPQNIRQLLLQDYLKKSKADQTTAQSFIPASIQRLCQALGAFARLSKLPDMGHFKNFIPPACRILSDTLNQTSALPQLTKTITNLN